MKYDTLKALVNAKVYENTKQRITGGDMNTVLQSAIASLGAHYQMGGLVSPADQITVGDEPVVFLATTPGTYTYFGGIVVADGEVALLVWSGTAWSKQTPDIATGTEVSQLGQEVIEKTGGIYLSELVLEQGSISSQNGTNESASNRIRTNNYIVADRISINTSGNKVFVVGYKNDGTYVSSVGWLNTNQEVSVNGADKYRLIFAYNDNANFTPSDYSLLGITINSVFDCKYVTKEDGAEIDASFIDLQSSKLEKVLGDNLVNEDGLTIGVAFIRSSNPGDTASASINYGISDYIKVNGQDIISNAFYNSNYWSGGTVYDANKTPIRNLNDTAQYTYQPGDAYVRFSFSSLDTTHPRANYGTTLKPYKPYTDYLPLSELEKRVEGLEDGKLDKIPSNNLFDKDSAERGKYLSANGSIETASVATYCVSDYIRVDEKDIISNCVNSTSIIGSYNVYDENKSKLRTVTQNSQYTYQSGDYYVRFCFGDYNVGMANYGTTLASYQPFSNYYPVTELEQRVSTIEAVLENYTGISLFSSIGVVGDSYSSGAIYGIPGVTSGEHYSMSWPEIMAKRNGILAEEYATPGQNATKFIDPTDSKYSTYGLGALLADTAKDLYFIMLGINGEPEGVSIGTVSDCKQDWTQNANSFCGNYGRIIGNIKQHAPSAKIICIKPNMWASNHAPISSDQKNSAIQDVAEFYGVPVINSLDDDFFKSTFYTSCLSTEHPVGITYSGMAMAFERLYSKCVQDNTSYFMDYVNNV